MRFGVFDHRERRGDDLHRLYQERLPSLERDDGAGFWAINITLLWKRIGIEPAQIPLDPSLGGDVDRAMAVGACIAGSPSKVADRVAACAEDSTADLLVASFTWGDLTADESLRSLDLFVEHAMSPLVAS